MKSYNINNKHNAKLSIGRVSEIKRDLLKGVIHREIAKKFGIRKEVVDKISSGRCWPDVGWPCND